MYIESRRNCLESGIHALNRKDVLNNSLTAQEHKINLSAEVAELRFWKMWPNDQMFDHLFYLSSALLGREHTYRSPEEIVGNARLKPTESVE